MINYNHLQVCGGMLYTIVIRSQLCVLLTACTNKKKNELEILIIKHCES